nr:transposase [Salsuginibacillus kocurii]
MTRNKRRTLEGLRTFYELVESTALPPFHKSIRSLKNWETEILNSFAFGYSNGFIEGINNQTNV